MAAILKEWDNIGARYFVYNEEFPKSKIHISIIQPELKRENCKTQNNSGCIIFFAAVKPILITSACISGIGTKMAANLKQTTVNHSLSIEMETLGKTVYCK